jgi:hypothetical protein
MNTTTIAALTALLLIIAGCGGNANVVPPAQDDARTVELPAETRDGEPPPAIPAGTEPLTEPSGNSPFAER